MRRNRFHSLVKSAPPLLIILSSCVWSAAAADPTETKVTASDAGLGDRFGSGVAIAGEYAVIGAQADNDGAGDAGSAYVLDLATAAELRKLHASDAAGSDFFGCAVAALGDHAVVGALRDDHVAVDAGSAYLFDLTDGTELRKFTAGDASANDWLGNSVALSPSYVLAGAYKADQSTSIYDSGAAYLFDAATGTQLFKLTASDAGKQDWFGYAVAVSDAYAVVGAPTWDGIGVHANCGAVYVFDVSTGAQIRRITTPDEGQEDRFGNALAISGDTLLVGAYWDGESAPGVAYLFDLSTGELIRELVPSEPEGGGDWFGSSVALSGNYALVGASQQGYGTELPGFACVFDITTGQELWKLTASDRANDDNFGVSVAIQGPTALVAADMNDDNGTNSGSAYFYEPISPSTGVGAAVAPKRIVPRNHPNPFNPNTEIRFTLPSEARVSLEIYDVSGRLRRTLLRGERLAAGEVRAAWEGAGDDGRPLPSGVYFYRIEAGQLRAAGKMTLVR
ncbi:MAG: PQQ-binding-like beta-propeller repeat protein [Candidatus Eisenbacteria bacterium]|nr:PQQ-binding-like beta-propeller repeat protein [Candidatus Eisenbacteria bacterium]